VKPDRIARSSLLIAALASVVRTANADPAVPAASPDPVSSERIARFALVQREPSAALDACGGATALKSAVERRLDRLVFTDEGAADSILSLSIAPLDREPRWQAEIVERDRSGTEVGHRELVIDAEGCEQGIDTLSVVLAIMIGPPRKVVGRPPADASSTPAPEQPRHAPAPPSARARRRTEQPLPPSGPRWTAAPGAAIAAGSGILPGISWGVEAGVVVHPASRRFSVIARGQIWPVRSTGTDPEGSLDRLSVALLGCYAVTRIDATAFSLCAGLDAGRLHMSAPRRFEGPREVSRLLLDVPIEGRIGVELWSRGSVRLEPILAAQAAVLLSRDRFTYLNVANQQVTLHRAAAVGAQATLGLVVHFGS